MTTKGQPSRCTTCGKGLSPVSPRDEEEVQEFQAVFPGESIEEAVVVCEECWQEVMAAHPELRARLQEHTGT